MKKAVLISFLISLTFNFSFPQNYVVGYYPNWLTGTLPPHKIKFENLTHVIHSFAWPTGTGEIQMYSGMPSASLIEAAHNAGKKVLLAFGGWGQSAGFAPLAADSSARAYFIDNVVQLFSQHQLDGIDLDWEYPSNMTEGKNLTTLVKELRERFDQENPEWIITMAVSAGSWTGQYLEYPKLAGYVEWFGVMTYDFHGSWTSHAGHNSPLYHPSNCNEGSCDSGIKYLTVTRQVPKDKVLLGTPFYGREFNATGLYKARSGGTSDFSYAGALSRMNNGAWEYYWDDFSKVPYLLDTARTKFVSFEDTISVKLKCRYALDNNLKGVMIWALGQDVVGDSQPLLETVGREMRILTSVELLSEKIVAGFYLFDNYPNPFNPATIIRYLVPETSFVNLKVYDVLGKEVAILVNGLKFKGSYEVSFDASEFSSGLYTYILSSENFIQSKKMLLIK
jgi:chitinase